MAPSAAACGLEVPPGLPLTRRGHAALQLRLQRRLLPLYRFQLALRRRQGGLGGRLLHSAQKDRKPEYTLGRGLRKLARAQRTAGRRAPIRRSLAPTRVGVQLCRRRPAALRSPARDASSNAALPATTPCLESLATRTARRPLTSSRRDAGRRVPSQSTHRALHPGYSLLKHPPSFAGGLFPFQAPIELCRWAVPSLNTHQALQAACSLKHPPSSAGGPPPVEGPPAPFRGLPPPWLPGGPAPLWGAALQAAARQRVMDCRVEAPQLLLWAANGL